MTAVCYVPGTVIIECGHCHAKYQYDEAKFEGKPSKKIRCAKCQQVFEIFAPAKAPAAKAEADSTVTRSTRTFAGVAAGGSSAADAVAGGAKHDAGYPPLPENRRYSIAVIDGPDAGTVHRVEKSHIVIGRSGADIPLNDNEASRNHAAIDIRGGLVLLEDLGSTNGTMLDGERISEAVEIQNHTEFQIGSSTLMLIITEVD